MQWRRVKWSEAGQITSILGWDEADAIAPLTSTPAEYFRALRGAGRKAEAASFLGQALPRLEAVAWGARSVRDLTLDQRAKEPEAAALKAALLWIQDPSETRRRACYDTAMAADSASPESLAAMAAFYSGGSISPPDNPPVPAPKDAAGRFAAGAVVIAAARSPNMSAALVRCLDAGEAIAAEGVKAGAAA